MENKNFNVGDRVFLLCEGTIYEGKIIAQFKQLYKRKETIFSKILCYNSQMDMHFETIRPLFKLFASTEELIKNLIANRELFPDEEAGSHAN